MSLEKTGPVKHRSLVRLVLWFTGSFNSLLNKIFQLSLFLSVMVTGILMILPVVGVWTVFVIGNYLPFPFGAILIWGMAFVLVALAAATDYVRSI
jgi:hypothetical protein